MIYVLDTNTLIYFFKGLGGVSDRFLATPPSEIGIPAIVLFELEVGIGKSRTPQKRKAKLQEFISLINGPYDILIAASAMANNGTLVTHNLREFERIKGLKVEDWY